MEAKFRAKEGVFMEKWERECQVFTLGREKEGGLSVKKGREERGRGLDFERRSWDLRKERKGKSERKRRKSSWRGNLEKGVDLSLGSLIP